MFFCLLAYLFVCLAVPVFKQAIIKFPKTCFFVHVPVPGDTLAWSDLRFAYAGFTLLLCCASHLGAFCN